MNDLSFLNREHETKLILNRIRERKSMLVHGPMGIGKSALLKHIDERCAEAKMAAIYCPRSAGFHTTLQYLARTLLRDPSVPLSGIKQSLLSKSPEASNDHVDQTVQSWSSVQLRGVIFRCVEAIKVALLLDHVGFVSPPYAQFMKKLMTVYRLPVILAARSCHMEAVGYLARILCAPDERLALKTLAESETSLLIDQAIARFQLAVRQRERFKHSLLGLTEGNPGAILEICSRLRDPKYQWGDDFKLQLAFVDWKMNRLMGRSTEGELHRAS